MESRECRELLDTKVDNGKTMLEAYVTCRRRAEVWATQVRPPCVRAVPFVVCGWVIPSPLLETLKCLWDVCICGMDTHTHTQDEYMQIREEVAAREGEAGFSAAEEPVGEDEFKEVRLYSWLCLCVWMVGVCGGLIGLVWLTVICHPSLLFSDRSSSTRATRGS